MRKFGNFELIRAKFVDIFRDDNKANAMYIETVQSKSEREKKTELGKYTCRLAQSTVSSEDVKHICSCKTRSQREHIFKNFNCLTRE